MSKLENNGGSAFPIVTEQAVGSTGLSKRDYACIHLRVPDSEHEWLNDIIRKAQRDEFAAKAMAALIMAIPHGDNAIGYAQEAYEMADAMLKTREQ